MKAISREKSRKVMNKIRGITSKTEDIQAYKQIDEYYFNKNDYEVFEEYHTDENNSDIRQKRIQIQEKLLNINEIVKEKCETLGLYNHWKKENITSAIEPNPFNNWKLNWIGIRYGRHKNQIDELNTNDNESVHYGFHKYCCMQFNISLDNFEVGIYHAVANEAVDRKYLREALENNESIRKKLIEELKKIKGNNLIWTIWSPYREIQNINFSIDNDNIEDFPEFYLQNDKEGSHSALMFRFEPDDERLKTKESIAKLVIEKFELLLPLYNTIIWKSKK